jgi:hypothetical protein
MYEHKKNLVGMWILVALALSSIKTGVVRSDDEAAMDAMNKRPRTQPTD